MATRLDVVLDASSRIGDLEQGTLTGAVDSSHPVDTARTEPDGHWTDAWLSINGIERRVTGYLKPGQFETNAFPVLPVSGATYELRKDQLHTRQQLVAFSNAAVRDAQLTVWVLVDSYLDALGTLEVLDGVSAYPVPAEMECLYGVLYQLPVTDNDANWYPVGHNGWFINEPELVTLYEQLPVGSRLRLLGTRRPYEMPSEDALCEVEPNFVSIYAAKLMSLRMMKGSDAERMKTVYAALREEEQVVRRTMRIRQPNNVRRVRPTGSGATSGHAQIPVMTTRAAMWFVGENPPNYTIGRPGDLYLQANGVVWQFYLPGGWAVTGVDITGPEGVPGPTGPEGPEGMIWRGTWQSSSAYLPDDAVHYSGTAYICIQSVTAGGPAPEDDLGYHWNILALEGAIGPIGAQGPAEDPELRAYVEQTMGTIDPGGPPPPPPTT